MKFYNDPSVLSKADRFTCEVKEYSRVIVAAAAVVVVAMLGHISFVR